MHDFFRRLAKHVSSAIGSPYAFVLAFLGIFIWGVTGPIFNYSDTWQLVINTTTTIITFLVVFMIQNTQNRDSKALHLKIDELIHAVKGARNHMVNLEDLSDQELAGLESEFKRLRDEPDSTDSPSQ